jgi:segregation and condensation protein A
MSEVEQPRVVGAGEYVVALPVFEGPLDLLLHLIQKHELSIMDIPVSFVTEKYVEYISLMQSMSIDVTSEYLVMAATLVHIKSKSLLPPEAVVEDDEDAALDELDPREELIRRLLEYQKYKQAAADLNERGAFGRDVFGRGAVVEESEGPAPLAPTPVWNLLDAFAKVLSRAKIKVEHEISFDQMTVTERIQQLCDRLATRGRVMFDDLFEGQVSRFDLIITFLALLEMTRLKLTKLYQVDSLTPIHIELAGSEAAEEAAPADEAPADETLAGETLAGEESVVEAAVANDEAHLEAEPVPEDLTEEPVDQESPGPAASDVEG